MIAATSGGAGDIVYSIPVLHKLGVKILYVKDTPYREKGCTNQYLFVKRFVESQGIQCLPTNYQFDFFKYEPGLKFDYDMDVFRKMPGRRKIHIMTNLCRYYGLEPIDFTQQWIAVDNAEHTLGMFDLVNRTGRWRRDSKVDWKRVFKYHDRGLFCFTGSIEDYVEFTTDFKLIPYIHTVDLLELARYVRDCENVFCNQNVLLTLAQGMLVPYYVELNPGRTNVLTYTPNENILNEKYYYNAKN